MTPAPLTVLLVEDNPGDARLLREALADAGEASFRLVGAGCLEEAFARLKEGEIDAILLDLTLPDSRGLETFLEVRARAHGVAIVVLSGLDDHALALRAVKEGAQDYLVKGQAGGALIARSLLYAVERQRTLHLEEQLRQAQKMEAIGRLAGGVAHDINNTLMAVSGYAELILRKLGPDHPLRKEAGGIQRAAEKSAALTRQLLAFGRRQAVAPEVVDLNRVLARMDGMIRRLVGADIDLVLSFGPSLGRVKADPVQIEQVVMNLVLNARDAMPRGGRLVIATADGPEEEGEGPYVGLSVTDNGSGMDEATRARIFEPFFTTKAKWKGAGLGLSTVYGIVEGSGGRVRVESAVGKGSRFEVRLPRVAAGEEALKPAEAAAAPSRGETVLVVDDTEEVRKTVGAILEAEGYAVLQASHGAEAIETLDRYAGPLHLLVTDMVMPSMTGSELAREVLARRPGLPVLFLSGYSDEDSLRRGAVAPGTAFLTKPTSAAALSLKVRELLDAADPRGAAVTAAAPEGRG